MASSLPSLVCPPTSANPSPLEDLERPGHELGEVLFHLLFRGERQSHHRHPRQRLGTHRENIAERVVAVMRRRGRDRR